MYPATISHIPAKSRNIRFAFLLTDSFAEGVGKFAVALGNIAVGVVYFADALGKQKERHMAKNNLCLTPRYLCLKKRIPLVRSPFLRSLAPVEADAYELHHFR